jgi:predicted SnoaL-like aldol condensation-catalyzing enzyme
MSQENYTDEEKRNLKLIEPWARSWTTHGLAIKMVDEIYANSTEVFTPLQKCYYVKKGGSKENWRQVELEAEKSYKKREMRIVNTMARGDTVALEVATTVITHDGKEHHSWFAAFLTFDKDGRVVTDHTYMTGPAPKSGNFPPGLKEAMDKIAADNR